MRLRRDLAHRYLGEPEKPENHDFFNLQMSPVSPQSPPQRVARDCHILRDQYQVDQIQQAWSRGKSLFVLSHALHIRGIEPALRGLKGVKLKEVKL